ncbi:hypothetical protein [Novosphingobium terrae]|uniref:hypothetical protein n=1 Tax=Novosphingobium terrae TaxID=2726189 RepID=UPI00197EBF7F|nr:hypothetical protein [Novosphingobium terrae]
MKATITRRDFTTLVGMGAGMIACGATRAWAAPSSPGHHSLLIFSDPLPGQEEAYAQWQRAAAARTMLSIPGVLAAHHFVPGPLELRHTARKTPAHLTIYTIQSAGFDMAAREIARRGALGQVWPPESSASVQTFAYRSYRPTTPGVGGEPQGAAPGTKERTIILAFGDAVAGQEAAYDDWYDHVHQPELMGKAGVLSGTRDILADIQPGPPADRPRYLFTMELLTSDLAATFRGILNGAGAPSPALDRTRGFGFTYRPA